MELSTARCLVAPSPEVQVAPDLFRLAGDSLQRRRLDLARAFVRAVDRGAMDWFWDLGGLEWGRRHRNAAHPPSPRLPRAGILVAVRREVAERDRWTCQYCGLRLLSADFLTAVTRRLPEALAHGDRDNDMHPAWRVLRYTPDHVEPRWAGGKNDGTNLVASCGVCNYQKGQCSLDELGLDDPRIRPLRPAGGWDGLAGLLGPLKA